VRGDWDASISQRASGYRRPHLGSCVALFSHRFSDEPLTGLHSARTGTGLIAGPTRSLYPVQRRRHLLACDDRRRRGKPVITTSSCMFFFSSRSSGFRNGFLSPGDCTWTRRVVSDAVIYQHLLNKSGVNIIRWWIEDFCRSPGGRLAMQANACTVFTITKAERQWRGIDARHCPFRIFARWPAACMTYNWCQ
jgi:hypothetical protein